MTQSGTLTDVLDARISRREDLLFKRQQDHVAARTDRMFAVLMVVQWLAGIVIAATVSPRIWAGRESQIHPHVWMAVFLGGLISSLPVFLAIACPGRVMTRYVIAVAQMLWSALLIHLTGGRIEAHFHVFGSLAFLATYRDWRVLMAATVVVALHHFLAGIYLPESVYGVGSATIWRTLEHAAWVLFEDAFLVFSCVQQVKDAHVIARRRAEAEWKHRVLEKTSAELNQSRMELEQRVADRTTELAQRNTDLEIARGAAEAASVAKSSFLANMSHEIRTPITAIVGYSDMLLEPDQSLSDRHDYLQVIRRSARHLMELINNILDISKIEAGKMTAECARVDLPQLVGDVTSILRPRALEKGLGFQVAFEGAIPRTITTDPLRVRQILMNLLSNSLKFTQRGEVRLRIACVANGEESSQIRFDISDTGIGMTDEQLATLFKPFTQADQSMTRRFGGTGLGLAISARLSKLLGGELTAKSLVGVGSNFTATIAGGSLKGVEMLNDLTEATLGNTPMESQQQVTKLQANILLAEDGVDNQRLISLLLRKAGAQVTVAENGRIAVDLACSREFDLILMDMQMPEMDGYAATSELRSRGKTLPIVALTAHALAEDRAKCLAAGCTDYLTKPIRKETLINAVATHVKQPAAESAAPVVPAAVPAVAGPAEPKLRSAYAGDPDMQEIIGKFISELPGRVSQLEELMLSHDFESLRRVVHQLKGAGGGYGFGEITTRAAEAERTIKTPGSIEQIERDVKSLIGLIQRVDGFSASAEGTNVAKAANH